MQQRENRNEKKNHHQFGLDYRRPTVVWTVAVWTIASTSGIVTVRVRALMAVVHIRDGAAVGDAVRNGASVEVVVGEVQVLQLLQVAQAGRNVSSEVVGLEVQSLQFAVGGDPGGNGVLEVAVVDCDCHQAIRKRAPLRWDPGAEHEVLQLQGLQVLEPVQSVARSACVALVVCHRV